MSTSGLGDRLALDNVVNDLDSRHVMLLSTLLDQVVLQLVDKMHCLHRQLIIGLLLGVDALVGNPQHGLLRHHGL